MHASVVDSDEWVRAREELYETYEGLSFSFGAGYFANKRLSPDDIRQCCRIGVVQAIDAWNPERGSLTTMIAYWVSREIRWWLRQEQIYRTNGPSDQDDTTQEECQDRSRRKCELTYVSFEEFGVGHSRDTMDFTDIAIEQSIPGHEEEAILAVTIDDALAALEPDKREIVERYYGLKGHDSHTLRELMPFFHVTHQTIKNRLGAAGKIMAPLLEGYR
jgi:RNA polymerase sigma factor (sigma-70 family)